VFLVRVKPGTSGSIVAGKDRSPGQVVARAETLRLAAAALGTGANLEIVDEDTGDVVPWPSRTKPLPSEPPMPAEPAVPMAATAVEGSPAPTLSSIVEEGEVHLGDASADADGKTKRSAPRRRKS
jgi:hypothetical protein